MTRWRMPGRTGALIRVIGAALVLANVFALGSCSTAGSAQGGFSSNPITAESVEGLILEGVGPIPARLIYRSRNTISSEEDSLVLETISQELDRLVELAGRLDEVIMDETFLSDLMASLFVDETKSDLTGARAQSSPVSGSPVSGSPVSGSPVYDSAPGTDPSAVDITEPNEVPLSSFGDLSVNEMFERVGGGRRKLLEARLDVVRKANEAKQRKEELVGSARLSQQALDILRKDLEAIKEAQRVMATTLSDVINATTSNDPISEVVTRGFGGARGGDAGDTPGSESGGAGADAGDIALFKDYLSSLNRIYDDKSKQLSRVSEALDNIVRIS